MRRGFDIVPERRELWSHSIYCSLMILPLVSNFYTILNNCNGLKLCQGGVGLIWYWQWPSLKTNNEYSWQCQLRTSAECIIHVLLFTYVYVWKLWWVRCQLRTSAECICSFSLLNSWPNIRLHGEMIRSHLCCPLLLVMCSNFVRCNHNLFSAIEFQEVEANVEHSLICTWLTAWIEATEVFMYVVICMSRF